ncbi:allantoate amidohydrolase [Cupriavidus basilensis OR16]|uniref:Allantoate amidohydrolase n=1 Tax=Cupriavidus basilensis OR16 TaxID=1127483 RepID=H1S174_9BURK|nr:Zn-dependent hydrolase [Cupriavidus basilensis]EHP43687.1 allantoate amidohydrolase [Cupriavidus basilensis OR16]
MTIAEPDLALATALFDRLREQSFDGVGVTRDSYGAGEQRAHQLVADAARALELEVATDAALNLYLTLSGTDRGAAAVMTGSHLDSVPRGGNFDGAAGVVAGLAVLAGWRKAGFLPRRDVTVAAIRAEESAWFPVSYAGSKAAFGLLEPQALDSVRADTGRSLADHLREAGGRPDDVRAGLAHLRADRIDCFIELHIEQGPVLLEAGDVVGIVTGICGSQRYRHARVQGAYAHSGATPRSHRQDAVVATAALIHSLQQDWIALEAQGHELTLTFGRCMTDPDQADFSKVAGLVEFSIDMRSRSRATLDLMDARVHAAAAGIGAQHHVQVDLGAASSSAAAQMDPSLQRALLCSASQGGIRARAMPSGAGHDAALFAAQGIPAAMIFVRNTHGSHNPNESMDLADFAIATRLLADTLAARAG